MNQADLGIYQGDDFAAVVIVNNGGSTVDLTTYTITAQIRRDVADNSPAVACEMDIEVDGNQILLSLDHDATAQLSGDYVWDLQLVDPTGKVDTILAGGVCVTQEVTRT